MPLFRGGGTLSNKLFECWACNPEVFWGRFRDFGSLALGLGGMSDVSTWL